MISGLWRVDDAATARLMHHFYTELVLRQRDSAAALRPAQLALVADARFAAPYFWAPFFLTGASGRH